VRKEADRLLRILNGLGRLGGQQQLTAGHVFRSYADGRKDAFVFVGGAIDVRGHVNPVTVLADGKPVARREPRESAWVTAALADPVVEKVVALYRLEHNWANLSKVLEAIEEDVGPAHRQGWVSRSARGRFRHTANSYRATGEGARHPLERHAPPENPMPLSEGEELVAHVLQRWLESRAR
jgi:hypothetical protein